MKSKIKINKIEIKKWAAKNRVNHLYLTQKEKIIFASAALGVTQKQARDIILSDAEMSALGLTAALKKEIARQDKIQNRRAKLRNRRGSEIQKLSRRSRARREFLSDREYNREDWKKILAGGRGITALSDGSIFQYAPNWVWNEQTNYQRRHGYGSGYYTNKIVYWKFWSERQGKIITKKEWPVASERAARKIFRENFPKKEMKLLEKSIAAVGLEYNVKEKFFSPVGVPENNFHIDKNYEGMVLAREAFQKRAIEKKKKARNAFYLANAEKIFVRFSDSVSAGNCKFGTRDFERKYNLYFCSRRGRGVKGDYLLRLRDDEYTRRAVVAAGIRQGL